MRQISRAISGARPSVASSRISTSGLVISARPMVSICCSPPESCWPPWPRRSCQAREGLAARARRSSRAGRACRRAPPSPGSPPRSGCRRCRGLRARRRCPAARSRRAARPVMSRAHRRCTVPPRGLTRPIRLLSSVLLPMPLRPIRPMVSPRADRESRCRAGCGWRRSRCCRPRASIERCQLIGAHAPRRGRPPARRRRRGSAAACRWRSPGR